MRARRRSFKSDDKKGEPEEDAVAHAIDTFSCKTGTHDVLSRARLWSRALTFARIFHQQVDGKSRQAFREWNRPNDDSSEMQFQEFKMKRVVCQHDHTKNTAVKLIWATGGHAFGSAAGHGNRSLQSAIRQSWNKQSRLYSIVWY